MARQVPKIDTHFTTAENMENMNELLSTSIHPESYSVKGSLSIGLKKAYIKGLPR